MATCNLCEKSGWLVTLDEYGLCSHCETFHSRAIASNSRAVSESLEIIESSKNPLTRLSRIRLAIGNCLQLEPYARKGIRTTTAPPREVVRELSRLRVEIVKDEIRGGILSARKKASEAVAIGEKLSGYLEAIEKLLSLLDVLDDTALVDRAISAIRAEHDTVHFDHLFEEGQAAEASGDASQALETYAAAMVALGNFGTSEGHQQDRIDTARERIADLGGDAPY